jgi:hypothetical protein
MARQRLAVRAAIESIVATVLLLPPNSPDFNPIEQAFSKLKAYLRKAAERTVYKLWNAIGRNLDLYSPQECANYFAACGYDPVYLKIALVLQTHKCALLHCRKRLVCASPFVKGAVYPSRITSPTRTCPTIYYLIVQMHSGPRYGTFVGRVDVSLEAPQL